MRVLSSLAVVVILFTSAIAQDPVKIDPAHYKVEFENARVRVLRIKYGPHDKSPMHEHPDGIAIFLTPDKSTDTLPDGTTHTSNWKAGETTWTSAGKHAPDNTSDKPLELILVELKDNATESGKKTANARYLPTPRCESTQSHHPIVSAPILGAMRGEAASIRPSPKPSRFF